ncbi:MAG: hypothetical protein A2Y12_20105 [Planctomycetes bacterium GWF2_42_9]|nr:MAG: hypothetical protein A2Y12_20105 [Planctomycetes bacterium GWF2_42_9]
MKSKITTLGLILWIVSLLIVVGCKKQTEPSPIPTESNAAVSQTEQTTCPVMGGAINKDIFVEYQGKKVYFCCPACIDEFNKEPEKYLPKLPQFKK